MEEEHLVTTAVL